MNELARLLDNRATYRARWMPIYLEPVALSGERFTVGVAAIGEDDYAVHVIQTMRQDVIKALFGRQEKEFTNLVTTSLATVSAYAEKHKALEGWKSIFSGVSAGRITITRGQDMRAILNQGITMCSSMARLLDESAETEDDDPLLGSVKSLILQKRPALTGVFNQQIDTHHGGKERYNIVTDRYIANYGVVNARQTYSINAARVKILALENLHLDKLTETPVEMVITFNEHPASARTPGKRKHTSVIESDADLRGIPITICRNENEIADYLLSKIAA